MRDVQASLVEVYRRHRTRQNRVSGARDLNVKSSSYLPQHDIYDGGIHIYLSDKNMALPVERYGLDAKCHSEDGNTGSNSVIYSIISTI